MSDPPIQQRKQSLGQIFGDEKGMFSNLKQKAINVAKIAQEKTLEFQRKASEKTMEMKQRMDKPVENIDEPPPLSEKEKLELGLFGQPLGMCMLKKSILYELCIDYLDRYVDEVGIYRLSGAQSQIKQLQYQFEMDQKINLDEKQPDPHCVASLLKAWFRSLPECILTEQLRLRMIQVFVHYRTENVEFPDYIAPTDSHPITSNQNILRDLKSLIRLLPDENKRLLSKFLPHLNRVAKNHTTNKMGLNNLQLVWSPTLMFGSALLITMIVQHEFLLDVPDLQQSLQSSAIPSAGQTSVQPSVQATVGSSVSVEERPTQQPLVQLSKSEQLLPSPEREQNKNRQSVLFTKSAIPAHVISPRSSSHRLINTLPETEKLTLDLESALGDLSSILQDGNALSPPRVSSLRPIGFIGDSEVYPLSIISDSDQESLISQPNYGQYLDSTTSDLPSNSTTTSALQYYYDDGPPKPPRKKQT
ncbi:RhoGAP domain-containing protein [Gorgonomyces haynaldii]|nr:RhoGAP domain-containing protein [Gorgonomyces haynaldii]